jgi:Mechanosensitive ion channel
MNGSAVVDSGGGGLLVVFRALIHNIVGPAADRPVLGSLSWTDVGSCLAIASLALIISTILAAIAASRARAATRGPEPLAARHIPAIAFGRPAQAFIWGFALYLIISALLPHFAPVGAVEAFQGVVDALARVGTFVIIVWLIYRLAHVLESRLIAWATRTQTGLDNVVLPLAGKSLRVMLPVLGTILALPILDLPERYGGFASRATSVLFIGAVAAVMLQATRAGEQALLHRYNLAAADNLRARTVHTQVRVIGRVIDVLIGVLTVASVLMLFTEVRQVGASLLAGFQIALAQPMREDDVVVVEGEWGRIEEITLTYVVIHIWDDRRLVVPLSYFIEKPFANWTRTSAQILGQVIIWVDYAFPVEEGRGALKHIIEGSARWDRRFWNLQVTDTSERTMQLRVLATSADSSTNFDLRCEIREKFIAWLQQRWPQALPRLRGECEVATPTAAQ